VTYTTIVRGELRSQAPQARLASGAGEELAPQAQRCAQIENRRNRPIFVG